MEAKLRSASETESRRIAASELPNGILTVYTLLRTEGYLPIGAALPQHVFESFIKESKLGISGIAIYMVQAALKEDALMAQVVSGLQANTGWLVALLPSLFSSLTFLFFEYREV